MVTLPADEMACKELVEAVTGYLEGTLSPNDRRRFEEHLGICRSCRIYLDQMRKTIATLGRLDESSLSPEDKDTLLRLFRGWRQEPG